MHRKLTGFTAAIAMASSLMLIPIGVPSAVAQPVQADFSVVNGTVTNSDEWPSFVRMDLDENREILAMLRAFGIEDIPRFVNDYNYAVEKLREIGFLPEDVAANDPDVREVVLDYQNEAREALEHKLPYLHNCGGTVIAEHWVLTAAHCVSGLLEDQIASLVLPANGSRVEKRFEIAAIHTHPKFEKRTLGEDVTFKTWDVALIRTTEPFTGVPPMTFAGVTDNIPRTGTGVVIGAGGYMWNPDSGDYDRDETNAIRQATVPFNEVSTCDETDSMICAEQPSRDLSKPNPASCYGDSGGPLTIVGPDGRKVQYGIVSHTADVDWLDELGGQDCGHAPTNYTAIPVVAPWINQVIGQRSPLAEPIKPSGINPEARAINVPIPDGTFDATAMGIELARLRAAIRPEQPRFITGVVLANDRTPADALASGVLQDDQLMMLTNGVELDKRTLAELQALQVKQVTLLGGPKAMSTLVESQLISAGFNVKRYAGESRVQTAKAIAESRILAHPSSTHVMVSRGWGKEGVPGSETADALALGALAAREGHPTILSPTESIPQDLLDWLQFSAGYKSASIVGGLQAVSDQVADQLRTTVKLDVNRIAGEDRVKTAIELAKRIKDPKRVVAVDAKNVDSWKAAFQVAGIAADLQAPVVLTDGDEIPEATKAFIKTITPADKGPVLVCVAQAKACSALEEALGLK